MITLLVVSMLFAPPAKKPRTPKGKQKTLKAEDGWSIIEGSPFDPRFKVVAFRSGEVDNEIEFAAWIQPKTPTAVILALATPKSGKYRLGENLVMFVDGKRTEFAKSSHSVFALSDYEMLKAETTANRLEEIAAAKKIVVFSNLVEYKLKAEQIAGLREFSTIVQEAAKKQKK